MKFVLACYGSRGDVEPSVAVGRELLARGHEVHMAVPADLIGLAEAAGVAAVPYGPDLQALLDAHHSFWRHFFGNFWNFQELVKAWREVWEPRRKCWAEMSATLTPLAEGADLLVSGLVFEEPAANVAEHHAIPFATLHYFPIRANGRFVPSLPPPLTRAAMTVHEWLNWRVIKKAEDAQRRELGLPEATAPSPRRVTESGSMEIQAYDEVFFPGLAAEWSNFAAQRPFVGALTMELPTDADEEAASWIVAGAPPVFFGFGSLSMTSPAETLAMISAVCAQLGERALVCAGWSDFGDAQDLEHVKVVGAANYAAIFPMCRAVVHHGGVGTTAIGLRAAVPQLILSTDLDQTLWGARVKRLKVGTTRSLSSTTQETLMTDLRTILGPQYVSRARELATQVSKSTECVAAAADHLEDFARSKRVG
ncbi:glycosyl transferase family 1 [Mycolicibacterium sp. GF69]|uniref:glycosyltransferase n=1 Tax=Mycolicibacterium sp. GF69 TaxID=2267251 RepID=UPI000DCC9CA6|nr:glycosyltransferase [Mycolicibacterium sp. GF69]RAV13498.1 glycosyl transferase family 1 [Mycolicibacterium sp. GF69]